MSLLQPAKPAKPANASLDLSFAVNENDVRHLMRTSVPQPNPEDTGVHHLCRVLCYCAEKPSALSIAHEGAEAPLLPVILAYLAHATGILSATADHTTA